MADKKVAEDELRVDIAKQRDTYVQLQKQIEELRNQKKDREDEIAQANRAVIVLRISVNPLQ